MSKLTEAEILKALECCKTLNCVKCGRIEDFKNSSACLEKMIADALELINRQKTKIEEFAKTIVILEERNKAMQFSFDQVGKIFAADVKKIKSEAYKEFAEEFEKRCIASGIYPAITKNILKNLVKEKTEESNGE